MDIRGEFKRVLCTSHPWLDIAEPKKDGQFSWVLKIKYLPHSILVSHPCVTSLYQEIAHFAQKSLKEFCYPTCDSTRDNDKRCSAAAINRTWRSFASNQQGMISVGKAESTFRKTVLEHVSASRQDPNGVFLAQAPIFSEFLFFRYIKTWIHS
uniref:Uncharacterized protein n=1 Tax=Candidatus Kentrum sp. LPFa TaxID=2126335 RepID=A0A450W9C7_9GAMM|nr:MAG: hypothetical protein BECKLPF1236B_GA0070989_10509 [Candidatus Kentron sp. LPFa]